MQNPVQINQQQPSSVTEKATEIVLAENCATPEKLPEKEEPHPQNGDSNSTSNGSSEHVVETKMNDDDDDDDDDVDTTEQSESIGDPLEVPSQHENSNDEPAQPLETTLDNSSPSEAADKGEEAETSEAKATTDDAKSTDGETDSAPAAASSSLDPVQMIRKGAVAALGGTMVGVGLVMIPLPTPFGAVVASSGMAVLGTEFEGAKEMNDKILDTTKTHLGAARDRVIETIESLDEKEEENQQQQPDLQLENADSSEEEEDDDEDETMQYMNPAERERQKELKAAAAAKNQTAAKNPYNHFKRRATSYLNRNLVPLLKRTTIATSADEKNEELADAAAETNDAANNSTAAESVTDGSDVIMEQQQSPVVVDDDDDDIVESANDISESSPTIEVLQTTDSSGQ